MKVSMINPDNQRIDAEIVRYFQNVNDKYIIYTLNEKDNSGFAIAYAVKITNQGGLNVGVEITDPNEWKLVKDIMQETVKQNKENLPITINDANPNELNNFKIDSYKPFKLPELVVEIFGKNKKQFDIVVEQKVEEQEVTPVALETSTPVVEEREAAPVEPTVEAPQPEIPRVEPEVAPAPTPVMSEEREETEETDYKALYEQECVKNDSLMRELEDLMRDYVSVKVKLDQIKELFD